MELKQLEFFIAACDCGSFGRAAQRLYTSQPNVSKVIHALEKELGGALFERTSRGIRLTPYGKSVYGYAENILKNADLITDSAQMKKQRTFCVSTFSSNLLAWLLVELYRKYPDMTIEHRQGIVQEITNDVDQGISELGVLYVSKKQLKAFRHIIAHKKLEFTELGKLDACIYVGPNSPLYGRESVTVEELAGLRFIRGLNDYFSMEHNLEQVDVGALRPELLHPVVYTNSEHFAINLLVTTDLATLEIDMIYPYYQQYNIRNLRIEGEDAHLTLGYLLEQGHALTEPTKELIGSLSKIANP